MVMKVSRSTILTPNISVVFTHIFVQHLVHSHIHLLVFVFTLCIVVHVHRTFTLYSVDSICGTLHSFVIRIHARIHVGMM